MHRQLLPLIATSFFIVCIAFSAGSSATTNDRDIDNQPFDAACNIWQETLHQAVANSLVRAIRQHRCEGFRTLLDANILFTIPGLGIAYDSSDSVVKYLFPASSSTSTPSVSSTPTSNRYRLIEDDTVVDMIDEDYWTFVKITRSLFNLATQRIDTKLDIWVLRFNADHRIMQWSIHTDTFLQHLHIGAVPPSVLGDAADECALERPEDAVFRDCLNRYVEVCANYGPFCTYRNTLEKAQTRRLLDTYIQKRYEQLEDIFALDIVHNVNNTGELYIGKAANLMFAQLSNPRVSGIFDHFDASDVIMVQRGRRVWLHQTMHLQNIITNIRFEDAALWLLEFDEQQKLISWEALVDGLTIVSHLARNFDLDILELCSRIARNCQGDQTQYPIPSGPNQGKSCIEYLEGLPTYSMMGELVIPVGANVACYSYHEVLSRLDVSFCPHVGGEKMGPLLHPCQDYW